LRFDDFALQPKTLQETFSPVSWLNDALATTRNDAESSTAAPAHGDSRCFQKLAPDQRLLIGLSMLALFVWSECLIGLSLD